MRSVFVIDLRHNGGLPRELEDVLELMGWTPVRPGMAYALDWREAIEAPYPGSVWDRIHLVHATAQRLRLGHRLLTMRPGEKIPVWGG